MGLTRTLAELRSDVRHEADDEEAVLADNTRLTRLVNQSARKLYGKLLRARGDQFFEIDTTVNTTAGNAVVALFPNVLRLTSVHVEYDSQTVVRARRGNREDLPRYASQTQGWGYGYRPFYLLTGYQSNAPRLRFYPTPQAVHSLRIYYIPTPPLLVTDEDALDGISGWEEWVILDVAIGLLSKEESDVRQHLARMKELEMDIAALAKDMDEGEPSEVVDVRHRFRLHTREDWERGWEPE